MRRTQIEPSLRKRRLRPKTRRANSQLTCWSGCLGPSIGCIAMLIRNDVCCSIKTPTRSVGAPRILATRNRGGEKIAPSLPLYISENKGTLKLTVPCTGSTTRVVVRHEDRNKKHTTIHAHGSQHRDRTGRVGQKTKPPTALSTSFRMCLSLDVFPFRRSVLLEVILATDACCDTLIGVIMSCFGWNRF